MNKKCVFLLLILPILFLAGCAQPAKVSSSGFASADQNISVPHPVEYEKNGTEYVTILWAILDPGVWGVEGFSHEEMDIGIFPFITDSPIKGYGILTDFNRWADHIMQVMLVGRKRDIERIAYVNKDGHFIYNIKGDELEYDPDKFDKDPEYKKKIFSQIGMTTVEEIETFWREYSEARGVSIPSSFRFIEEIQVGSPRWEEFKADLATRLTQNYKTKDGQIRQGFIPLDDFREEATKNNGATPEQRFARNFEVSPFLPAIATSFINSLIKASVGPIEGFYSLAECRRGDMKERFRELLRKSKERLKQRDAEIYYLRQELSKYKEEGK